MPDRPEKSLIEVTQRPPGKNRPVVRRGQGAATAQVVGGRASVTLPRFSSTGAKPITVAYLGDTHVAARTVRVTLHVVR